MGKGPLDFVPMQLTKAFRDAQSTEAFQSWLKMQDAAMQIEFPIFDVPEIRNQMHSKDSLAVVEARLLNLYLNHRVAFSAENVHTTMKYVYYIGETFRRAFEGVWVALPNLADPTEPSGNSAIDFPMREAYIEPASLVEMAINRRSGNEIAPVYGFAERDYIAWVEAGRPERTYLGRLREDP